MMAGIIAAGDGSRLAASHPGAVKPLVPVAGKPLCHWVVAGLAAAGAERIAVLTNSRGGGVSASLSAAFPGRRFDFLTADTSSSFESFRLVARRLAESAESFLISTVDALIPSEDVRRFYDACRAAGAPAGLALTRFVDDEKPLWADVDPKGRVAAVGEAAQGRTTATCGLYYMTRSAAADIPAADAHGRLRDFWAELARRVAVAGVTLSKTLDVDRPEDVAAADAFLRSGKAGSAP